MLRLDPYNKILRNIITILITDRYIFDRIYGMGSEQYSISRDKRARAHGVHRTRIILHTFPDIYTRYIIFYINYTR